MFDSLPVRIFNRAIDGCSLPVRRNQKTNNMKKTLSIVVITGDNIHHVEQIKSTHPSPISQAMANVAYRYRKAGKGSPTILKAY